jgi:uncharacterized protein (TIGR03435 family)
MTNLEVGRPAAWLLILAVGLGTGMAQTSAPVPATAATPAKALAFDVISIRQDASTQRRNGPPQFGPTADGYRMVAAPLVLPIITAYIPQAGAAAFMPDQIKGLPDWVMRDAYDIDAKVSEEDIAEWQKPASQKTMLPAMMQSLLEERFKIAVHRETKDEPVYLLTVGKGGPKFKETDPTVEHPDGLKLPWGGVLVQSRDAATLYGASMASLATLMSSFGGQTSNVGRQIQDKTGLTGRYDVTIKLPGMGGPPSPGDAGGASDPASMVYSVVDSLGLKLESGKSTVETLVIDHIEKPSEN